MNLKRFDGVQRGPFRPAFPADLKGPPYTTPGKKER